MMIKLAIDPDAKPVAYYIPISDPLHWQEGVEAELDQDVRLGVIEPVPIRTPVTWCLSMLPEKPIKHNLLSTRCVSSHMRIGKRHSTPGTNTKA